MTCLQKEIHIFQLKYSIKNKNKVVISYASYYLGLIGVRWEIIDDAHNSNDDAGFFFYFHISLCGEFRRLLYMRRKKIILILVMKQQKLDNLYECFFSDN